MEALLNAFWLLIAFASFGFWLRQRPPAVKKREARAHCSPSFVYLACFLLLLFPSVSVSDDFQAQQAVLNDSDCRGPVLKDRACPLESASSSKQAGVAGTIPPRSHAPSGTVIAWFATTKLRFSVVAFPTPAPGRAPPCC